MGFGVCSHCEFPPSTPSPCLVCCPTPASSRWGGCAACPGHCCSSRLPRDPTPARAPHKSQKPLFCLFTIDRIAWGQAGWGPEQPGLECGNEVIFKIPMDPNPSCDFHGKRNPFEKHEVNTTASIWRCECQSSIPSPPVSPVLPSQKSQVWKVTMSSSSYDNEGCGWEVSEVEG